MPDVGLHRWPCAFSFLLMQQEPCLWRGLRTLLHGYAALPCGTRSRPKEYGQSHCNAGACEATRSAVVCGASVVGAVVANLVLAAEVPTGGRLAAGPAADGEAT